MSVLSFVLYKDGDKGAKFAFGVLLCYAVLFPVAGDLSHASDVDLGALIEEIQNGALSAEHSYYDSTREALEEGLAAAICAEFSLDESEVSVSVSDFDFNSMSVGGVRVSLRGKSIFANIEKIKKYVAGAGLGGCEVSVEL